MKILFLTYDIPYPLDSGGKARAYHLLKQISNKHEVTLISFYRTASQLAHVPKLKQLCTSIVPIKRRTVFSPQNLMYLPKLPFPASLYYSADVQRTIETMIAKGGYDLVHFESFYTSMFLSGQSRVPQIIGTENIEWKIYHDYALKQQNPVVKKLMLFEASRTKQFEMKTWKAADMVIAVSDDNAKEIAKETGQVCPVVRNGVDTAWFHYQPKKPSAQKTDFLFVGNFNYVQNTDAVEWLISTIWPKLQIAAAKKLFVPHLTIAGKGSALFRGKTGEGVTIVEKVDDMRTLYYSADLLLAPIRIGSGTKFKVLEAMATGTPVITTDIGIEGITSTSPIVQRANDVDGLVAACCTLATDRSLRLRLSAQARKTIEQTFDWRMIGADLLASYERVIHNHR